MNHARTIASVKGLVFIALLHAVPAACGERRSPVAEDMRMIAPSAETVLDAAAAPLSAAPPAPTELGEAVAEPPEPLHVAPEAAASADARVEAPTRLEGSAAATLPPTDAVRDSVRARLGLHLAEDALEDAAPGEPPVVRYAASFDRRGKAHHIFVAEAESGSGASHYLVLARFAASETDIDVFDIGESTVVPGSEETLSVSWGAPPTLKRGWAAFAYDVTRTHADFATDGECDQRSEDATTRSDMRLICPPVGGCVTLELGLSRVARGFERDCEGRKTRREDSVEPFQTRVAFRAPGELVIARTSGKVPDGLLGTHPITDDGLEIGTNPAFTLSE